MTSHSNFIFQERRELWDDVLKIVNAERNGAYDLRRIEVQVDIQQPCVEERSINWIFPDKQTLMVNEIFSHTQALEVKEILDTLYRPHDLLEFNESYSYKIFYRTRSQVTKEHPVFNKLNKYLKHMKDTLLLKDERGNNLNIANKSLLESSVTFLETYLENLIHASLNKDNEFIGYLLSPKVLLISETGDVYQISIETAFTLLSITDIYGTSSSQQDETELNSVHNEENIHFKALSNAISKPRLGNEFISYALSKTLTNEPLITPSILMKLLEVPQVPHLPIEDSTRQLDRKPVDVSKLNYFIQASRSVGDQDFHRYLENRDTDVQDNTTFDKENLSWHFILSLFLQPGDEQSDKYAVEVKNKMISIVGIDNDKVFYPNIYVSKDTHYVNVQCFLYAWKEFMELDIDENVRDRVLKTSPSIFLLNWTSILELQNNVYENLKDKGYLNSEEANELQLPLMFTEDIVSKVSDIWENIQANLSSRTISHNGILKHIDPCIASWYKAIRDKYLSILEVEHITSTGFDDNGKRIYLKDVLEGDLREQLKKTKNTSRVPDQSMPMQQFYESIMQLFKEKRYIDSVWYQLESIHVHDDIYNRLYEYNPNAVDLIDSNGKYPLDYALEAYIDRNYEKPFIRLVSLNAQQMTSNYMRMHSKMEDMMKNDPSFKNSEIFTSYLTWIHRYGGKGLWEITTTQIFPEYKGEGSYITGSHCGKRYLRNEIKDQLNNDNNNVKYGRYKVKQVHYKGFKVNIKYYPEFPGNEEAVGILFREIIGWGTPYGELFKLEDGTPVWISLSIEGEVLQDVMDLDSNEYNDTYESQLDNKYMSDIILMSMLMNPEDGKPDNFKLEHINNSYRLVCVDNDQCFVPAYVQKPGNSFLGQMKPVCQVKSILYCLPHMNEPVHDETKQKFISLHMEELLKHWLEQLNKVNESYITLFNNDEMKQLVTQNEDKCFTRVGFQSIYIEHIYTKFYKLQDWLKKKRDTTISHIDLLSKLEPYLASNYRNVLYDDSLSIWDRFEDVDIDFYGNSSHLVFESFRELPIGKTLLECIQDDEELGPKGALRVLNNIISQNKYENLTFDHIVSITHLEDTLKDFNFIENDYMEQLNLVKQLSNRKLMKMTIRNCKALNDDVIITFQLKQLRQIEWIDVDITIASLRLLTSKAKYLESLYLYKCSKLNNLSMSLGGADNMIQFKSIKTLKIRRCSNIKHVLLDGPNISTLEIHDCKRLTRFEMKSPKLERISIQNTALLNSFLLSEAPLSSYELYKLTQCITNADIIFDKCSGNRHDNFVNIIKELDANTYNNYIRVLDNDPTMTQFHYNKSLANDIVQHIQNNTNLNELSLEGCIVNISSLEAISKMFNLRTLNLSINNIGDNGCEHLSKNTTLTTLNLYNNNIGDNGCFYLSKISTLTILNLSGNKIGPNGCKHLSKSTTLTTLNLSWNDIGPNGCEYLSKNITLTTLNLSGNKIGDKGCEHISKITTLTTLDFYNNNIGPNGCEYLSNITTLTTLNLSINKIGPNGCEHLSKNTTLTTLYLSSNKIGDNGCEHISKITTLTTLNLYNNNIGDKGCFYLSNITTLTTLDLYNNNIGPNGCKHLSKIKTLTTLNLSGNKIGPNGCEHLSNITTLTTLDLSINNIGDNGCKHLSKITTLTTLNLYNNKIGDKGCEHISNITNLTTLNLRSNNIGDNGCKHLSNITTLTTLDLSYNNIGDEGCKHLSKITTLTTLNLSYNKIGDDGCEYLSKIKTLTTLNLRSNNIGPNGCEYLSKNTTLTTLDLSGNKIGPNGCEHLTKVTTLTTLNLSINNIGDNGCEYLSKITTLTTLDLYNNNIGDKGCLYLSNITTLTTLYLGSNNIGDIGCEHLSKNNNLKYFL